jgi:curved DNA-binding protein CbpA
MKPSQAKNLYEIMELDKTASPKAIDIAFRKQALLWHPDKHIADLEDADSEFKILMNAYCILSDPIKKLEYDRYHFKRNVFPNYGKFRDERLTFYRARQRASINRMLKKQNRSFDFFRKLSKLSLVAMIAAVGCFFYFLFQPYQNGENDSTWGQLFICLPFFFFNGAMICYVIAQKELIDNRKRCRSLAIKLYSLIDEQ